MGIFSINIKTLLLCAASLTILLVSPSSAKCNNHLLSGERLSTGQSITDGDSVFLTMQKDCNLVLYDKGRPIAATYTVGLGSGCFVTIQNDGNLVIYDSNNKSIWASNSGGDNGNYILILQKDRNLVIYGQPIWALGTNSVGSVDIIYAAAHNGMVGISGTEQNKVRKMGKIVEIMSDK